MEDIANNSRMYSRSVLLLLSSVLEPGTDGWLVTAVFAVPVACKAGKTTE